MPISPATNAPPGVGEQDPTKSITLRNQYSRAVRKRFRQLRGLVRESVIENDALGILSGRIKAVFNDDSAENLPASDGEQQAKQFQNWFDETANKIFFGSVTAESISQARKIEGHWQNKFVRRGYLKGLRDASVRLRDAGIQQTAESARGVGAASIEAQLGRPIQDVITDPIHQSKLTVLNNQNFQSMKSIIDTGKPSKAGNIVKQTIARGLTEGKNPRDIAQNVVRAVNGQAIDIAETNAEMMARTEVIRAHHVSSINRYKQFGTQKVAAKAEWRTAGDGRVCPLCLGMEGRKFPINEAQNLLPLHPRCRCTVLPITPLSDKGARATRRQRKQTAAQRRLQEDHGIQPDEYDPLQLREVKKSRNFNAQAINEPQPFTETQIENSPRLSEFTS